MYSLEARINFIVLYHLKVVKRVDPKSSHHKKKFFLTTHGNGCDLGLLW